jgi:hypothetical protein
MTGEKLSHQEIKNEHDRLAAEQMEFRTRHEKQVAEMQSKCDHPEYQIMYYSWRIGCMEPMRFCSFCGKMLDKPSREEFVQFKEKELEDTKATWAKNYPGLEFPAAFQRQHDESIAVYGVEPTIVTVTNRE